VTARKPLVPPELRELLTLLADLAELLPMPANGQEGAWDRRSDLGIRRQSLLTVRLGALVDTFAVCDQYPSVAAESLAVECARGIKRIRECLAEPLGYEPEAQS
jgi:hypothetical protein